MTKIRILLIEDNRLLREGIVAMINGQPDMRVVAASGGKDNDVLKARKAKAHVVLLDIGLETANGLRIVASFVKEAPEVKVIGMGLIPHQSDMVGFVQAGASGFILKDATVANFLGTIRTVALGGKVLPPTMTNSLFSHVIDLALKKGKDPLRNGVRMTKRERELIVLIAEGLSNKEIALRLGIEIYTVKSHVHNILEKLALHSRLQISAYAHDEEPIYSELATAKRD
ncbi:MAG: LuxR C-terminal-related transcriptional regulator [Bacteroidota bacterium]